MTIYTGYTSSPHPRFLRKRAQKKIKQYPINICKIYVTKKKFRKPGIFDLVDPDSRELTLYNCGCIVKD